jgi:hypothetical protein
MIEKADERTALIRKIFETALSINQFPGFLCKFNIHVVGLELSVYKREDTGFFDDVMLMDGADFIKTEFLPESDLKVNRPWISITPSTLWPDRLLDSDISRATQENESLKKWLDALNDILGKIKSGEV